MDDRSKIPLSPLDPEVGQPGYWMNLHERILRAAAPELARRRVLLELTFGDVIQGWARALVPMMSAAAILAGLVLSREPAAAVVGVEEILLPAPDDPNVSALLSEEEVSEGPVFASLEF